MTSFKEEWKIPAMKYDEWNEWKNTNPWLISTNSGLAGTPVSRVLQISLVGLQISNNLFVLEGWVFRGCVKSTAAVHAYYPIESDGSRDKNETRKSSIRHGVFFTSVVRECRKPHHVSEMIREDRLMDGQRSEYRRNCYYSVPLCPF